MSPLLPDGSYVIFRRARKLAPGDTVLVEHPQFGPIVKNIARINTDGRLALEGISPASTSSAKLGLISPECIRGKMIASRKPKHYAKNTRQHSGRHDPRLS